MDTFKFAFLFLGTQILWAVKGRKRFLPILEKPFDFLYLGVISRV